MNYANSACSGLLRWAFIAYGAAHGVTGSRTVNVNNALFTLYPSYLAHAVPPPYCHNVPGIQEPMLIMFQVMKRDCGNVCILKIFISQEGYMVGVLCPILELDITLL